MFHSLQRFGLCRQGSQAHDCMSCRICMESKPVERLISPCNCRGTMKYVHVECLQHWRATCTSKLSKYRCDQCHGEYSISCVGFRHTLMRSSTGQATAILFGCASVGCLCAIAWSQPVTPIWLAIRASMVAVVTSVGVATFFIAILLAMVLDGGGLIFSQLN
eukprot:gnl/TRDRNA2_/TRDRNA2_125793_c0_seq1.p2 gnl/TRDRNA2_/TRDRNA2_125793_c0~~gnl/TRDRNA2_/TRDRNA2_125793_c0_seq1.p2  ORF type:complete len:162 (+),score=4.14 gnl/TRDRNA2_/TRDRNA2_125793_c0_seq1:91-576(+)